MPARKRHTTKPPQKKETTVEKPTSFPWQPSTSVAFKSLAAVGMLSAFVSGISDCDETYNYWEPTHYLLYGKGFQTWEYSPEYALRSYLYLWLHAGPAWVFSFIIRRPVVLFFLIRLGLAAFASHCETILYHGVKARWGPRSLVPPFTLVFLMISAGLFHASPTWAHGKWMIYDTQRMIKGAVAQQSIKKNGRAAVFGVVVAVILGWPFSGLAGVPLGLSILWSSGLQNMVVWLFQSLAITVIPSLMMDTFHYGTTHFSVWNLIKYNVLGGGGGEGSALYGTEPWYFYIINLGINFGPILVLAFAAPMVVWLKNIFWMGKKRDLRHAVWRYLAPLWLWFMFMTVQAHKEERFMFVVYPFLPLAAAITLDAMVSWMQRGSGKWIDAHTKEGVAWGFAFALILTTTLISVSRLTALHIHHNRATMGVWDALANDVLPASRLEDPTWPVPGQVRVCVGKSWYEFSSSFFLHDRVDVVWLESNFTGLLPAPFPKEGTQVIPKYMNDENRQEMSRYVPLHTCNYIVDMEFPAQSETIYSELEEWDVVREFPRIDPHTRAPRVFKAFWIPGMTLKMVTYGRYVILKKH